MSELFTYNIDYQTFHGKLRRLEEYLKTHCFPENPSELNWIKLEVNDNSKTLTISKAVMNAEDYDDVLVFTEQDLNSTLKVGLMILGYANVINNLHKIDVKQYPDIVPNTVYRNTGFDGIFTSWNNEDEKAHQEYLSRKT